MRRNPWYCEVMRPSGKEHELKVWLSAPAETVRGFFLVRGRSDRDFDGTHWGIAGWLELSRRKWPK